MDLLSCKVTPILLDYSYFPKWLYKLTTPISNHIQGKRFLIVLYFWQHLIFSDLYFRLSGVCAWIFNDFIFIYLIINKRISIYLLAKWTSSFVMLLLSHLHVFIELTDYFLWLWNNSVSEKDPFAGYIFFKFIFSHSVPFLFTL